jgi:hypothetical protein
MNRRLTLGAALVIAVIAITALVGHQLFGTAWSNHCDPGNAQFNLLKSDPILSFHPRSDLFTLENDSADNSWLCSSPSLSVSHFGDKAAIYAELRAGLSDSGWTELTSPFLPNQDFDVYQKDVAGGVRLDAEVRQQLFWVEVDLNAPGLHPGERGF